MQCKFDKMAILIYKYVSMERGICPYPLRIHFHVQFYRPTPSLENARFQWLVQQFGTLCQQTFGTLDRYIQLFV